MYEKITEYKTNNATLTEKKMKSLMCGKCFDVEPGNPPPPPPPPPHPPTILGKEI
jgi:hypothetical protein